ncbi:MAG: Hsp20/alpha crystallin family protein [Desulfobacterales bacterium]|nr:Hsp20/alpha crystallin family protein [Desulfobacterales bacterium]
MDYIKIRFGNGIDFPESIEDVFRTISPMFSPHERSWKPQMDIYETCHEVIILAELAGVEKDDLEVEINQKAVRIFGKRLEFPRIEKATYRLAEIQYGKFERILFLPAPIDTDKVTASHLNGFLQIRLAKLPKDKVHRIEISDE